MIFSIHPTYSINTITRLGSFKWDRHYSSNIVSNPKSIVERCIYVFGTQRWFSNTHILWYDVANSKGNVLINTTFSKIFSFLAITFIMTLINHCSIHIRWQFGHGIKINQSCIMHFLHILGNFFSFQLFFMLIH
jgi:hypothetical protein